MPLKQKMKGKKNRRGTVNPSDDTIIYRGPLKLPMGVQERQQITTVLRLAPANVTSTAGGLINFSYGDDPSSGVDWSHLAAAWDEYRTLGFTFHYQPYSRYNQPTTMVIGTMFTAIDRDDATTLTTQSQIAEYESFQDHNMSDPWKREVRSLVSVEDASYVTTATPVARNWLKGVSTGNTVSTVFGQLWIEYLIQLRGRN
jgi:hypothetical protein